MTTTPVTLDPATIQRAKANLALLMLSLGVPLLILSSYSLLRQAFISQAAIADQSYAETPNTPGLHERAPGLYQRSQPVPTATVVYQEPIPVPTAPGPVVEAAPAAPAEYGHDTTIPGCLVEQDGQMHCWGGFEPATWAMTSDELAAYPYYINDDTGQRVDLSAPATGFSTGNSTSSGLGGNE